MHRSESVDAQVLKVINESAGEEAKIPSWETFVKKHLLPELKRCILRFYGCYFDDEIYTSLSTEAKREIKYPGFNYSSTHHRRLLDDYPNHKHLFRAMDEIELTEREIYELCYWQGSLFQRRAHEERHKSKVKDTTGDEIRTIAAWDRASEELRRRSEIDSLALAASSHASLYHQNANGAMGQSGISGSDDDHNEDKDDDDSEMDEDEDDEEDEECTLVEALEVMDARRQQVEMPENEMRALRRIESLHRAIDAMTSVDRRIRTLTARLHVRVDN